MSEFDGIWDCIVVTPVGKEPNELRLQAGPDGTLTGEMKELKGGHVMPLQGGKVNGNKLTWKMQIVKPFKLTLDVAVEVSGNELKGHGGTAMLGKAPITGVKRA